jgi:hypothetical protein
VKVLSKCPDFSHNSALPRFRDSRQNKPSRSFATNHIKNIPAFGVRFDTAFPCTSCQTTAPKAVIDLKFTTPQIRAHFSPRFPENLNSGSVLVSITPCLIENSWSFYPHMGVEDCQTTQGSGHLINPKRYPIPGSIRALILHFRIGFPESSRSAANTNGK